jgi:hypothetical protein
VKSANLALRFILELCLLAAYAYLGGAELNVFGAIAAPLAVAIVWGLLVSPKARFPLSLQWWVGVQVLLFAGAVVGLAATGHAVVAALFAAVTLVNLALLLYWHQRDTVARHVSA